MSPRSRLRFPSRFETKETMEMVNKIRIRATAIEQDQDRFWAGAAEAATEMASATINRNLRDAGSEDDITAGQKMINSLDVVRNLRAADLGVTSCCREVFFSNNNAEFCIMAPRSGPAAAATVTLTNIDCAVQEAQRRTISSTMDGFKKIARNEGFTRLWKGLSPTLVMAIPANMIYLTGYDWLRVNAKSPIAQSVPDDYTRLQATAGEPGTNHVLETFRGIQDMVSSQGYRSLWRGLTLTLWRDVPFSGIYWWGYEYIRGKLTDMRDERRGRSFDRIGPKSQVRRRSQSHDNHRETFTDSFIAGATSGAAASVLTMPFDVGKTRTQVWRDGSKAAAEAAVAGVPEDKSMVRLLWHIFKNEGVAGLWRMDPRTLKVAPACAIMISSYEVSKRVFRSVNEKSGLDRAGRL
ncbi:unnamed protein product [Parascedosporium putredinis]|uniref:Mitochondrial carrier protein n=1 Tax=Parascedosporium putredinis TaxID=1442378 RepID=A0A9P1HBL1_9PEZI|nr:unnamed protein product [Parascedosporium putredinis]CAI8002185.1 unnamed protein product [Parascedosporium putredinis]